MYTANVHWWITEKTLKFKSIIFEITTYDSNWQVGRESVSFNAKTEAIITEFQSKYTNQFQF